MNRLWRSLYYSVFIPGFELSARIAALRNQKIRRGLDNRRWVPAAGPTLSGNKTPRFWFHASSLGEFEQARPIIEELKGRHPDAIVWVTFFSPSGLERARGYQHADQLFYLPMHRTEIRSTLRSFCPDMVVFVSSDVWPGLVWEAFDLEVPVILVDAILRRKSRRYRSALLPFQRSYYSLLSLICAVTEQDARRLRTLTGPEAPIEVAGDSRFDRVWQRALGAASLGILEEILRAAPRPLLVAGSTYAPEERALVGALSRLGGPAAGFSLVIVPHEPTEERLDAAEQLFRGAGWEVKRLSRLEPNESWGVLLLDRVGVLAESYRHADFVLVGGSFRARVHNVMEPVAWGKPVIIGPFHENSPEATEMVQRGTILAVEGESELAAVLDSWLHDSPAASALGLAAKQFLESRLGASTRIADSIDRLLRYS